MSNICETVILRGINKGNKCGKPAFSITSGKCKYHHYKKTSITVNDKCSICLDEIK